MPLRLGLALCGWLSIPIAGCGGSVDPSEAFPGLRVERIEPLPEYRSWWDEIKECSGRLGADFDRLSFWIVREPLADNEASFPCDAESGACGGFWQQPHEIVLAPGRTRSRLLVQHEMLHDLLDSPLHPPVFSLCGVR